MSYLRPQNRACIMPEPRPFDGTAFGRRGSQLTIGWSGGSPRRGTARCSGLMNRKGSDEDTTQINSDRNESDRRCRAPLSEEQQYPGSAGAAPPPPPPMHHRDGLQRIIQPFKWEAASNFAVPLERIGNMMRQMDGSGKSYRFLRCNARSTDKCIEIAEYFSRGRSHMHIRTYGYMFIPSTVAGIMQVLVWNWA